MKGVLYSGLFSFIIVTLLLPLIIYFTNKIKLFVKPSFRKIHTGNISSMGGFAVFISVFISVLLFIDFSRILQNKFFFIAIILAALIGMQDDLKDVKASYKLLVQILIALIMVFPESLYIDFGNNIISILISLVFYIVIINSFNFIDGIDLLASIIAAIILMPLGLWFYFNSSFNFGLLIISMGAALLGFIIYNFSPAKIFLGDMGTMIIGLMLAVAFVKFIHINMNSQNVFLPIENPIAAVIAVYNFPIIDLFRVILVRISKNKKPWRADKLHLHHIMLRKGMKQNNIALLLALYTILSFALFYFCSKFTDVGLVLIAINIAFSAILFALVLRLMPKLNK